jgi:hypothetical protein
MHRENTKFKILLITIFSAGFTIIIYVFFYNSLGNSNFNSSTLLPEEAYIIVLHEVYGYPLDEISNITFNDVKDKFTYQYVMVRGNGDVFLLDQDNRSIIKSIGNTTPPITEGIHYAWEITINNTKTYVDSITGQIISSPQKV